LKEYLAHTLVFSLGLILFFAFFKPWLPSALYGMCLTAYEPVLWLRILEGIVGIVIMGFGIERLISFWRDR